MVAGFSYCFEATVAQGFAKPRHNPTMPQRSPLPSNKVDLANLAQKNKAPNDVMDILDLIPEKEYVSPARVMKRRQKRITP